MPHRSGLALEAGGTGKGCELAADVAGGLERDLSDALGGEAVEAARQLGGLAHDVLRNDLGLKGTRHGCGQGSCGACTVLIEGRPVESCNTPLSAAAGRQVTTIEGLGSAAGLHPLQQAFVDEQAGQCGYCLSGIIVAAASLLHSKLNPSDSEIRAALDGHLCRCGAHERIVRAIRRAAMQMAISPSSGNMAFGNPARGAA